MDAIGSFLLSTLNNSKRFNGIYTPFWLRLEGAFFIGALARSRRGWAAGEALVQTGSASAQ